MYHTDFEQYKNKMILEYPELKKKIADIHTDALSHRELGTCFWFDIAHVKVKELIAELKEKNTVVIDTILIKGFNGLLGLVKHETSDTNVELHLPISNEQMENLTNEKVKITIEKL